jgi:putative phosphoesterase
VTIGLISDTHGYFDETLTDHFRHCAEIWHAGDIGDPAVIQRLRQIAPVIAVQGNIDGPVLRADFPEDQWPEREGVKFLITHIAGKPPQYTTRVMKLLRARPPHALICGHSHICQVKKDEQNGLLFINPGAAGQQGFHLMRTALRIEVNSGKIGKLEVIELGKRGSIPTPGAGR